MRSEEFKKLCLSSGFSEEQFVWLEEGVKRGLDVGVYANPHFSPQCMEQLLLGLLHHVDVGKYALPSLDSVQMQYCRLLMEEHVFQSKYANGSYSGRQLEQIWLAVVLYHLDSGIIDNAGNSAEKMYQLRVMLNEIKQHDGEYDSELIERYCNMNEYQLYWINRGIADGADVSAYDSGIYNDVQMEQIYLGKIYNLDVRAYSDVNMLAEQMREIRLGQEAGVNVSLYAKLDYSYLQMRELRIAQQLGLDVTAYANPKIDYKVMHLARLGQQDGLDIMQYVGPEIAYEQAKIIYDGLVSAQSGIITGEGGYRLSDRFINMLGLNSQKGNNADTGNLTKALDSMQNINPG